MIWVIDTSALIRLFVPDGPIHPELETAFNRAATSADVMLAPQLLLVEAGNVRLRKQRRGEFSGSLMSCCKRLRRPPFVFASTGLCFCRPPL